jgi:hypothetical protein
MDENTSLINIGELSKPATVLIEKISDAVGGIFKPYQIVRIAKAEAQAEKVRVEGEIEISDLQRHAFQKSEGDTSEHSSTAASPGAETSEQ